MQPLAEGGKGGGHTWVWLKGGFYVTPAYETYVPAY
jgi:hypothetical protein